MFYLSQKTKPSERNYSSYELEVITIILALHKLRVYLLGLRFRIVTDCQAFQMTMSKRDICAKIARWALQLEEYDCEVVHRAGTAMRHVDALSRYPVVAIVKDTVLESVKRCQLEDTECNAIAELLKCGKKYKDYEYKRDILYRFVNGAYLLVVPRALQSQIIRAAHEQGHVSAQRTVNIVMQDYCIKR